MIEGPEAASAETSSSWPLLGSKAACLSSTDYLFAFPDTYTAMKHYSEEDVEQLIERVEALGGYL